MDPTIKDFESASAELEAIVKAERRLEILNERGELRPAHAAMGLTPSDESGQSR
jgi:hypothetical protein